MRVADIPPLTESCELCVLWARNDSLGSRLRWSVFASLCAVSLVLALGFAAMGAWLVLPYTVLEMALVYIAFRYVERHSGDWERVAVTGDRVVLERSQAGCYLREEFNRRWVRLEAEKRFGGAGTRLWLRYAGRRVGFGETMGEQERLRTVQRLRHALVRA